MNYNKIKIYGKSLLFKRGCQVSLFITYSCNFNCPYCGASLPSGKQPHGRESTIEEWKEFINKFPTKIKEFYVSGGEPTLYKDFIPLVEFLLTIGHVKIFTNLSKPQILLSLPKSYKLTIRATFHHSDDINRFNNSYNSIYKKHRIDVYEIGYSLLPYSILVPPLEKKDYFADGNFRISCDRQIFIGCQNHFIKMSQ